MHIDGIFRKSHFPFGGNMGVICRAPIVDHMGLSDLFRFFQRFFRPGTGEDIIGGAAFEEEIHGDHRKLGAGAALKEQHAVIIAETHQLFHVGFGFDHDGVEGLGTVAHRQHAHARIGKIHKFLLGFAENLFVDHGRAGVKIIYRTHNRTPFLFLTIYYNIKTARFHPKFFFSPPFFLCHFLHFHHFS